MRYLEINRTSQWDSQIDKIRGLRHVIITGVAISDFTNIVRDVGWAIIERVSTQTMHKRQILQGIKVIWLRYDTPCDIW